MEHALLLFINKEKERTTSCLNATIKSENGSIMQLFKIIIMKTLRKLSQMEE